MSIITDMARAAAVNAGWIHPHEWDGLSGDIGDGLFTQKDWIDAVRAVLAGAEKRGWVLVPKEPTDSIRAALSAFNGNKAWPNEIDDGWHAIICAAPSLESEDK